MPIKKIFSKIYSHRKAQAGLEIAIGGMLAVAAIGAIIGQGYGFAFSTFNTYRAERKAMSLSYQYSYGAFGAGQEKIALMFNPYEDKTGRSGSRSRTHANVILVEDRLNISPGKYGSLNVVPYMIESGASFTANMFMPLDKGEDYNLDRMDVYVNGVHFPFKTSSFREVNLYKPGSPFWEKYCIYVRNLETIQLLDADGNTNPWFKQANNKHNLPFDDLNNNIVIDDNGEYVGPMHSHSGEPMPLPLYGFATKGWKHTINDYGIRFLAPEEFPNAPFAPCMRLYGREYNQSANRRWCANDQLSVFGQCPHVSVEERFDLDLSGQMVQEEPIPLPSSLRIHSPVPVTDDVPKDLRPYFSWQWFPLMGVLDARADDNSGTYGTKEGTILRYGIPIARNTYGDFPGPGIGEKPVTGDRDLEEEQVVAILDTENYTGRVNRVLVLDPQGGDMNFSANDDEEIGFYFGKDTNADGDITVQAPVHMYTQIKDGTYLSIEDTKTSVITSRQKNQVDMIERQIKLSEGATATRWCAAEVDGEPNPVKACGGCTSKINSALTCFDPDKKIIYVRTIIEHKSGLKWFAKKK